VLNPFEVYQQGESILRGQLNALDAPRLRDIVRGYALTADDTASLMRLSAAELTDMIIVAVRRRPERAAGEVRADSGEHPAAP
jgi:hypothetical protein